MQRGFEVSTARWQEGLAKDPSVHVKVYAGGKRPDCDYVWCIARDDVLNSPLNVFALLDKRRYWEFCYGIEQISFALSIIPLLLKWRPDVIWTKEVPFAYFLIAYRFLFRLKYDIIFANGGAFRPPTYECFDFLQHLQHESYKEAAEHGIPAEKMVTLTNIIPFNRTDETKAELRKWLGLADDDFVVVSVAAWNVYHKRVDYLVKEVAKLKDPKVKLVLIGHPDSETDIVRKIADELLPGRVLWKTLHEKDVHRALRAGDVFVLASVHEGLGNAMAEAAMAPLPVICHSTQASRFIFQDHFWMRDLSQEGNLAARIEELRVTPVEPEKLEQIRQTVTNRFSSDTLVPQFVDMLRRVKSLKPPFSKDKKNDKQVDRNVWSQT